MTTILRFALPLLLIVSLAACSDDGPTDGNDDPNNNNNNNEYADEVTATINGESWTATNVIATRTEASGIVALSFVAYGPDDSHISFGIAFASQKTHTIDGQAIQTDFDYAGESYGEKESGTITISNLSTEGMRGTFTINAETTDGESGTATGSFDIEFDN